MKRTHSGVSLEAGDGLPAGESRSVLVGHRSISFEPAGPKHRHLLPILLSTAANRISWKPRAVATTQELPILQNSAFQPLWWISVPSSKKQWVPWWDGGFEETWHCNIIKLHVHWGVFWRIIQTSSIIFMSVVDDSLDVDNIVSFIPLLMIWGSDPIKSDNLFAGCDDDQDAQPQGDHLELEWHLEEAEDGGGGGGGGEEEAHPLPQNRPKNGNKMALGCSRPVCPSAAGVFWKWNWGEGRGGGGRGRGTSHLDMSKCKLLFRSQDHKVHQERECGCDS